MIQPIPWLTAKALRANHLKLVRSYSNLCRVNAIDTHMQRTNIMDYSLCLLQRPTNVTSCCFKNNGGICGTFRGWLALKQSATERHQGRHTLDGRVQLLRGSADISFVPIVMRENVTGILPGFIADGHHEYLCVGFNLLGTIAGVRT